MSQLEKRLARLRDARHDAGWDFAELCLLLQKLGFEMRVHGSHHFFRRPGAAGIINLQPRARQAKPYQVRQARSVLQSLGML